MFGLRITAAGAKSWICKTRVGTKQVFEYACHIGKGAVEHARELARASQSKAERGVNPVAEKQVEAVRAATNTIAAAVARYLAE